MTRTSQHGQTSTSCAPLPNLKAVDRCLDSQMVCRWTAWGETQGGGDLQGALWNEPMRPISLPFFSLFNLQLTYWGQDNIVDGAPSCLRLLVPTISCTTSTKLTAMSCTTSTTTSHMTSTTMHMDYHTPHWLLHHTTSTAPHRKHPTCPNWTATKTLPPRLSPHWGMWAPATTTNRCCQPGVMNEETGGKQSGGWGGEGCTWVQPPMQVGVHPTWHLIGVIPSSCTVIQVRRGRYRAVCIPHST